MIQENAWKSTQQSQIDGFNPKHFKQYLIFLPFRRMHGQKNPDVKGWHFWHSFTPFKLSANESNLSGIRQPAGAGFLCQKKLIRNHSPQQQPQSSPGFIVLENGSQWIQLHDNSSKHKYCRIPSSQPKLCSENNLRRTTFNWIILSFIQQSKISVVTGN